MRNLLGLTHQHSAKTKLINTSKKKLSPHKSNIALRWTFWFFDKGPPDIFVLFDKGGNKKGAKKSAIILLLGLNPKLYIPSTLNIDLILWHTQLIVSAVKF